MRIISRSVERATTRAETYSGKVKKGKFYQDRVNVKHASADQTSLFILVLRHICWKNSDQHVKRAITQAETYSGKVKVKLASDKSFILVTSFI